MNVGDSGVGSLRKAAGSLRKRTGWVNQAGELPNLHTPASLRAASKIPVRRTGKPPLTCRKTRNRTRSVSGAVPISGLLKKSDERI